MESVVVDVSHLRLDAENPRLPEALVGASQPDLLSWLMVEGVLNELASSMLENGFFPHEPLIVLPSRDGVRTVVEGNRRFASLCILLQLPSAIEADLEFDFEAAPTEEQLGRLRQIPCFEVPDRRAVRDFLGFRHIGGIKTWSPEAKARYIDQEVREALSDGSVNAFRDVGRRVGSNAAGVRGPYIALHILRAARDRLGIDAAYVQHHRFGVWNRMMNSADLRGYIGFGDARSAEQVDAALEGLKPRELADVIADLTPPSGQGRAVLSDSRDVTRYAAVLQNPRARETLRRFQDLNLATQVVDRASVGSKIRNLAQSVELLVRDINDADLDVSVLDASSALLSNARTLHAAVKDRLDDE